MGKFFSTVKQAGKDFSEDECMVSGAALAYYTIFSLPPLLVVVFAVAGWFGVEHETVDRIARQQLGMPTTEMPGQEQADEAGGEAASKEESDESGAISSLAGLNWISRVVGLGILVFSATGLFAQLQHALNRAWEVAPDPSQSGFFGLIFKRLLSLGMVAVIAFLLLVSFVLTTFVDEAVRWIQGPAPGSVAMIVGIVLDTAITLAVATLLFAAIFKVLPDAKTSWKDLLVGSFITALLFVIGKSLIAWYLQNSNIALGWSAAAASMVAILVWVYYSSLIVLFGAEMAQAWANQFGNGVQPAKGAVRVVKETRRVREESPRATAGV